MFSLVDSPTESENKLIYETRMFFKKDKYLYFKNNQLCRLFDSKNVSTLNCCGVLNKWDTFQTDAVMIDRKRPKLGDCIRYIKIQHY